MPVVAVPLGSLVSPAPLQTSVFAGPTPVMAPWKFEGPLLRFVLGSTVVSVARNTSPDTPPASHGRSPLWQLLLPTGNAGPPPDDAKTESFARSMPVLYRKPPSSMLQSGSLKPAPNGLVGPTPLGPTVVRVHDCPWSVDVHTLTWFT